MVLTHQTDICNSMETNLLYTKNHKLHREFPVGEPLSDSIAHEVLKLTLRVEKLGLWTSQAHNLDGQLA